MAHAGSSRPTVFIDGQAGTTGLRIRELLAGRSDLELLAIAEPQRKDPRARAELLNRADVSILCLPDDAAREAVSWIERSEARVIDASTAHRVTEGWVFGLPELEPRQRSAIARARRVSNPGCYPTGINLLLRPLIDAALIANDTPISIHALSGYTGGGNPMIAKWEDPAAGLIGLPYEAPYALERRHKHVPEMVQHSGLAFEPYFVPAVGAFRCGMRIQIPLHQKLLRPSVNAAVLYEALAARYADEQFMRVRLSREALAERELDPTACNDTNRVELSVLPHPAGHVLLVAVLDNLGKGAAGAAAQNLNLMLGLPEDAGLRS